MPDPSGSVVLDANLLLVFVLGQADPRLIRTHKRLKDYDGADYDRLVLIVSEFSELLLVPNIATEVSNIAEWGLSGPAVRQVGESLRRLVGERRETYVPSRAGAARVEFLELGLTDAVLLALLETGVDGRYPTLITTDEKLYNRGLAYGLDVLDYHRLG